MKPLRHETQRVEGAMSELDEEYTCAMCRNTYKRGWTDEEAWAEKEEWSDAPKEKCVLVCDDCWQIIKPVSVAASDETRE